MWSFLSDFARAPSTTHTVVVMNTDSTEQARHHQVRPRSIALLWAASLFVTALLVGALIAMTPLRTFIPGYATAEMRHDARLNALRVGALQDSLQMQRAYVERLQNLITGRVQATANTEAAPDTRPTPRPPSERSESTSPPASDDWSDHRQPAIAVSSFPSSGRSAASIDPTHALEGLSLPVRPPVESGFPTRGFDARAGHYAVDVAVPEGTLVRSIGAGYVVMSDWVQDGGYTVAVQHASGYLSIYKHNQRLLKHVGDHVQANEAVAVSGNTGEVTTGPHLHFELWRHGLAQDPRSYVAGW